MLISILEVLKLIPICYGRFCKLCQTSTLNLFLVSTLSTIHAYWLLRKYILKSTTILPIIVNNYHSFSIYNTFFYEINITLEGIQKFNMGLSTDKKLTDIESSSVMLRVFVYCCSIVVQVPTPFSKLRT